MHTGEIEVRADGDITGFAVNLAARVEQAADNGEIFVSSTVRDLILGGDTRFEDRGEHTLKGFDSPWRLYALADYANPSVEWPSSDDRGLPPCEDPACARDKRGADRDHREMADRKRREVAQATRGQRDVRTSDSEHRAERSERCRRDRGDAATCRCGGARCGERAQLAHRLAANEAHGHARIASASNIPTATAPKPMFASRPWLSRVSILNPYCVAMTRAALSSLDDDASGVCTSQLPEGAALQPRSARRSG